MAREIEDESCRITLNHRASERRGPGKHNQPVKRRRNNLRCLETHRIVPLLASGSVTVRGRSLGNS